MPTYSWDIADSLHSKKDSFKIKKVGELQSGWNGRYLLHVEWGNEWPTDWQTRHDMLATGLALARNPKIARLDMQLNGHTVPLYTKSDMVLVAFAETCYHLFRQGSDYTTKRNHLIQSKEIIEEVITGNALWSSSKIYDSITYALDKNPDVKQEIEATQQQINHAKQQRDQERHKKLKYTWRFSDEYDNASTRFKLDLTLLFIFSVKWGEKWQRLPLQTRYDILSEGKTLFDEWASDKCMVALVDITALYIKRKSDLRAGLADVCYQLYQEKNDADEKRRLIVEAMQNIHETCIEIPALENSSGLYKKIHKALLATQGARTEYDLWKHQNQIEITKFIKSTQNPSQSDPETASASMPQQSTKRSAPTPPTTAPTTPASITSAGGVRIDFGKLLGKGASATVYKGKWGGKDVAIKHFEIDQLRGDEAREFLQEATFMMNLQSPYLIKMHDFVAQAPNYCMVMEYMPHGSLYQLLGSSTPLPWEKRWVIAQDIAYGVAALHSKGIVHRDIKSLNVLIGHGMRAKLSDFGQAKLKTSSQSVKTRRGETGAVGTVAWLAPEILRDGAECCNATDIYSLGMTLWELGSGKTPFAAAPNAVVMSRWIEQGKREDLGKIPEKKLSTLINWCWEGNPALRPSAEKVIEALDEATPKYASQGVVRLPLFSQ